MSQTVSDAGVVAPIAKRASLSKRNLQAARGVLAGQRRGRRAYLAFAERVPDPADIRRGNSGAVVLMTAPVAQ
jgi:hypothetical protein